MHTYSKFGWCWISISCKIHPSIAKRKRNFADIGNQLVHRDIIIISLQWPAMFQNVQIRKMICQSIFSLKIYSFAENGMKRWRKWNKSMNVDRQYYSEIVFVCELNSSTRTSWNATETRSWEKWKLWKEVWYRHVCVEYVKGEYKMGGRMVCILFLCCIFCLMTSMWHIGVFFFIYSYSPWAFFLQYVMDVCVWVEVLWAWKNCILRNNH